MKAAKEEIRAGHRARRAVLDRTALEAAGAAIARHGLAWANGLAGGRPGTFAAYVGVGTEPPTLPLLSALHGAGHKVLLPVCERDINLGWVYWTPESAFARSRFAPIQEPVGERFGPEIMRSATGIFLPATAVDFSGNRIGHGSGSTGLITSETAIIDDVRRTGTCGEFDGAPYCATDSPNATAPGGFRRSPQVPSSMTPRSCPPAAFPRSPSTAGSRMH